MTLLSHVGQFHDLGICQIYYVSPRLEQEYLFTIHIHTFKLNLKIWMELYTRHYV